MPSFLMPGLQGELKDGRAWFREGERYGFVDADANIVIPAIYDEVSEFEDGLARVWRDKRYGCIDANGHTLIPFEYQFIAKFVDGVALAHLAEGGVVIIDREGHRVAPDLPPFDELHAQWVDGRVRVKRNGLFGFAANNGREAVPCLYEDAHTTFFRERAAVKRNGLWTIVGLDGSELLPPRYDDIDKFYETTTSVRLGRLYGRIELDGRECVPCTSEVKVHRFLEGRARVDLGPIIEYGRDGAGQLVAAQIGYVDGEGKLVIPHLYETATDFVDGRAWVTLIGQSRRFAIDRDGREL